MKTEEGKIIRSCGMANNCATCMFMRHFRNCRRLHEGDDPFCDYLDVVTIDEPEERKSK